MYLLAISQMVTLELIDSSVHKYKGASTLFFYKNKVYKNNLAENWADVFNVYPDQPHLNNTI